MLAEQVTTIVKRMAEEWVNGPERYAYDPESVNGVNRKAYLDPNSPDESEAREYVHLKHSASYGIREYQRGTNLDMHSDRIATHILS